MLNRRTLRVKAMQTLFAYKQGIWSNLDLARDHINETFSPNLNSMDFQDPILLKDKKENCLKAFDLLLKNEKFNENEEITDTAYQAQDIFKERNRKDLDFLKKSMIKDVDFVYDLYINCLSLIEELQKTAEGIKGKDYSNFVKNLLIEKIKLNKPLQEAKLNAGLNWSGKSPEIKEWFRALVMPDENFQAYNKLNKPSFENDAEIVNYLLKNMFFSSEVFNSYMEEIDLRWTENKAIVKSLVLKTFKTIDENEEDFDLQPLSYNWEEDKTFFIELFDKTIGLDDQYKNLIAEKAENWDIDRLAITDRVILEMAITEMLYFTSIPVKVTINEYIEVSKKYSTPRSKQFINGMLDVIADYLSEKGDIKKSGRGLIDNK